MNISYRRELKRNYLIVEPEAVVQTEYEYQMLLKNEVEGLLPCFAMQNDGRVRLFYEITSRQPLDRLLEGQNISAAQIKLLVFGIAAVVNQLDRFLLNESSILLRPEHIYVEPDCLKPRLCLIPGLNREFVTEYGKLLEYLLGHVDHQDQDSVVLAYGLYQETKKENYGIDDILKLMQQKPGSESAPGSSFIQAVREHPGGAAGMDKKADESGIWTNRARGWFQKKRTAADKRRKPKEEEIPWQHVMMEEAGLPATDFVPTGQNTVLLNGPEPEAAGRSAWLRAMDREAEDILLAYYPFVIGKQQNLVDYVLDRETVSRLHLKIDKIDEQYIVMDLNSTNGTFVNDMMLQNNGSAYLSPGDEVRLSVFRYRFEL